MESTFKQYSQIQLCKMMTQVTRHQRLSEQGQFVVILRSSKFPPGWVLSKIWWQGLETFQVNHILGFLWSLQRKWLHQLVYGVTSVLWIYARALFNFSLHSFFSKWFVMGFENFIIRCFIFLFKRFKGVSFPNLWRCRALDIEPVIFVFFVQFWGKVLKTGELAKPLGEEHNILIDALIVQLVWNVGGRVMSLDVRSPELLRTGLFGEFILHIHK